MKRPVYINSPISWLTSSQCVFLNKVPIILQITKYKSIILVLYCALQPVSAVQISHHQVDVGYTNRNIK